MNCLASAATALQVSANDSFNWWIVAAVGAALFGVFVVWQVFTRRWLRVKGIILLALAVPALPAVEVVVEGFGASFQADGFGWPTAALAALGIGCLTFLEWKQNTQTIVRATLNAFREYAECVSRGGTGEERLQLLARFDDDSSVDDSIFRICSIMDLATMTPVPSDS